MPGAPAICSSAKGEGRDYRRRSIDPPSDESCSLVNARLTELSMTSPISTNKTFVLVSKNSRRSLGMRKMIMTAATALPFLLGAAHAQDSIKIGYIDPLSGGGASVGEGGLKTYQFLADELNAKGGILGHKVEIVPMDNKTNPQESLVQAQKAVDAGIHYITQGNGSSVAAALEDFVTKNNARNPGKEMLFFNYAAVDPALTNE